MEIICIQGICECSGTVHWDIHEETSRTGESRCKKCKRVYRIDKLPLIDEVIED